MKTTQYERLGRGILTTQRDHKCDRPDATDVAFRGAEADDSSWRCDECGERFILRVKVGRGPHGTEQAWYWDTVL